MNATAQDSRRWPESFVELSAASPGRAPAAGDGPLLPGVRVLVLDEAAWCADINEADPQAPLISASHRAVVDLIATLPGSPPVAIWAPLANGAAVVAVGAGVLRRGWSTAVIGVSSAGNNSVVASWPGRRHRPIESSVLRPTDANEPLISVDALHGQAALWALRATDGAALGVGDAALIAARDLLRRQGLRASAAGSAGLAGLLQQAGRGDINRGRHVAILTA